MNYFKLVLAFLASASLVTSAPNAICEVRPADYQDMMQSVLAGDSTAVFTRLLEDCSVRHSPAMERLLELMIKGRRFASLQYLLPKMDYENPAERDRALTRLLGQALYHNSMRMVGVLLDQRFHVDRQERWHLWCHSEEAQPWNAPFLKKVIAAHAEQADDLAPTDYDMHVLKHAQDALFLIDMALFCDELSRGLGKQAKFDATQFLYGVVRRSELDDAEMAQVATRLLHLGANPNDDDVFTALIRHHRGYDETLKLLTTWVKEDIKEPGTN